jgi:hypothetical protein
LWQTPRVERAELDTMSEEVDNLYRVIIMVVSAVVILLAIYGVFRDNEFWLMGGVFILIGAFFSKFGKPN